MSRIIRSVLAAGAGVAVLVGGVTVAVADEPATPAAPAAAAAPQPTAVRLKAEHSGQCLTIGKASLRNGTDAIQSACADDALNQRFDMVPTGAGTFELRARHSGKCLEVQNSGTTSGSVVQQYWCGQGKHHNWRLAMVDIAKELYELRPAHIPANMTRCLDIASASKEEGAAARLWACNGTAAQKWRIEPVTAV
ncbi:RICIN domain-containing protein [Streptomyces sp. NPDC127084]|uniref:RICIN domain-containing protein n=1 Tax=Streptomyces sp. NPDC127084 TaxID=3347133 RepID=UPI0036559549